MAFDIHSDGRPLSLNTPLDSLDPDKDLGLGLGLAILLTGVGYSADRADGVGWQLNVSDNQAPPVGQTDASGLPMQVFFGVRGETGVQLGLWTQS